MRKKKITARQLGRDARVTLPSVHVAMFSLAFFSSREGLLVERNI